MKKMRTRTSEVFIDESEILHIKILKNASVDLNDAMDAFLVAKNISNGQPRLILADIRGKRKIAPKARRLFEKRNIPAKHIAKAVLINSTLLKNIHNIFNSEKNRFPVKAFTHEQEAITWLKTFN